MMQQYLAGPLVPGATARWHTGHERCEYFQWTRASQPGSAQVLPQWNMPTSSPADLFHRHLIPAKRFHLCVVQDRESSAAL